MAVHTDTVSRPHRRTHIRLSNGLRLRLQTAETRLPTRKCLRRAQVDRPERLPPTTAAHSAGPDCHLHQLRSIVLRGLQGGEPMRQQLGALRCAGSASVWGERRAPVPHGAHDMDKHGKPIRPPPVGHASTTHRSVSSLHRASGHHWDAVQIPDTNACAGDCVLVGECRPPDRYVTHAGPRAAAPAAAT